jgi:MoxR-like ATPase
MGINIIRDTIELAITISAHSEVPVLFLANPGLAKSTIISNWAARNGYHLETLIGSRFTQEEILGFQARVEDKFSGENRLELLEPYWYRSIILSEKQNIPSLLFLDELSTVQENVQGAMLQLVFERTIGHGKRLPASTIVVSAANYKQNIPFVFNIMAPILNRFCLVNLRYESNGAFLDEFLQDESSRQDDALTYQDVQVSPQTRERLREGLKDMWDAVFESFNDGDRTPLDINNQMYNNIYESDTGYVYNFITGRTLYYLYRITYSFLCKGLSVSRHGHLMLNMVFGLAGLGTNSFNEMQQKSYLKKLETLWTKLYTSLVTEVAADRTPSAKLDFTGKSVSSAVNEWTLYNDASIFGDNTDSSLEALVRHISGVYGTESAQVESLGRRAAENDFAMFTFTGDMQKIDYLIDNLAAADPSKLPSRDSFLAALHRIQDAYLPLREAALKKAANH